MSKRVTLMLALAIPVCLTSNIRPARATDDYKYDFALQKLWTSPVVSNCQSAGCAVELNTAWRSLMSQMGVLFAPQFLSPAETPGWHGFVLDLKYGLTSINDKADYWKSGVYGNPDPIASTLTLEIRKGIWLPLPSFELGGGFTHLVDSHMFSVNIFAKFAIHEGFHKWPTPAFAVRGYFQRILGTHQVDFTILSLDMSLSKSFGIAGTFNLTPYLGYNVLWIIAKSEVIDSTPNNDALQCSDGRCTGGTDPYSYPLGPGAFCNSSNQADCNSYYVFFDQTAILRHRLFFGVRAYFTLTSNLRLALTTEYSMTIKGASDDSYSEGGMTFKLRDEADMQHTWGISVSFDY